VDELLRNIVADFLCSVGSVGVFVRDGSSRLGWLELMPGIQSYPGEPGRSCDCLVTSTNIGDVIGMDIVMVAFNHNQLAITADILVPGSITRVQKLLKEEPLETMLGNFMVGYVNTCTTKTMLWSSCCLERT
jgi:hypothetical protein